MTGLLLGLLMIFIVALTVMDYSLKHDTTVDELIMENNALKEHIAHLEQDLQKYRSMEA